MAESKTKFVSCVKWIRRGVAQEKPDRIALSKDEVKALLEENRAAETEQEACEDEDVETEKVQDGSDDDHNRPDDNNDGDDEDEYDLAHYDDDDDDVRPDFAGLTCFSSNDMDSYLDVRDDEDESDEEDTRVRPDDNLVAVGIVEEDASAIEFYVYNEAEEDMFLHHSILLPSMPLCLEWLTYGGRGNFVAVGSMGSAIEIWDVDIMDTLEPAGVLGGHIKSSKKSEKKKKKKKPGHSDSVMSLAWNSTYGHVLASGSADHTVAVWDLEKDGQMVTAIKHFTEKVQALEWHPFEPFHLLTGSCDGMAKLFDGRNPDAGPVRTWRCEGEEVERVLWNQFAPFCCLTSTDSGHVQCFDVRREDRSFWTLSAHNKSCTGLALSSRCPGLLVTASVDERIKVWDVAEHSEPSFIHEARIKLGEVHALATSPDSPFVICAGGNHRSHNFKVISLMDFAPVQRRFGGRELRDPTPANRSTSVGSRE